MEDKYGKNVEEKWQKWWDEKGIYKFDDSDMVKPVYSIDTPPPFTSGDLHMGHVLSYSYFDFAARYKRMRGFNVYYPQGWDCQGFPTEVKVEQKHGRKPPEEFRKLCQEWTVSCIDRMKSQMNQMGFSPDWRYEYRTMSPDYHRKVQYSLLKMHEQGLVFRGKHPVFWCTKCMSALAKSDTEEADRQSTLNHLKFTSAKGDVIIATSRPELLHACVAVLFHPEDKRFAKFANETITTPLGKQVKMIPDKDVDPAFGTGALMVCTFGDKMDVVWMYRYKLPIIEAFSPDGRVINGPEWLNGLKVEEAKKKIIEKLQEEGKVVKIEPLPQVVKVHDRCKRPVELMLSSQWFCGIKDKSAEIIEGAKAMKWVPDFAISHLIDWANSVEWDWVISRQRVFGTPIPFRQCPKCGKDYPVDYSELPFNPATAAQKKCPDCNEVLVSEKSTCDCWVDSSITPLVISGWPDDNERFSRLYPSSLRPQGVEIVRTWAFYTIYRSLALTGKPPFKELLLNGNVLAPDGKKMSKSLGNIIAPDQLIEKYYTDSVRQWAALSGAMAKDRPFSYQDMTYSKSFLNKLWNASKFISTAITGYAPEESHKAGLELVDKWLLSRLNSTIRQVTEDFEKYEYHHAIKAMHQFFWNELCDYYLEYVKYRIYREDVPKESALAARYTLHTALLASVKMLAPVMPHATEEIYSIFSESVGDGVRKSIHKSAWPVADESLINSDAEKKAVLLNAVVSQVRQFKSSNKLALNEQLASLEIFAPEDLSEAKGALAACTGAQKITFAQGDMQVKITA